MTHIYIKHTETEACFKYYVPRWDKGRIRKKAALDIQEGHLQQGFGSLLPNTITQNISIRQVTLYPCWIEAKTKLIP